MCPPLALVGPGDAAACEYSRADGVKKGTGPGLEERVAARAVQEAVAECVDLEDVAVCSVALEGFGSDVAASDGGAQQRDSRGGVVFAEGAGREFVRYPEAGWIDDGHAVDRRLGTYRGVEVLDQEQELRGGGWRLAPGQVRGEVLAAGAVPGVPGAERLFVGEVMAGDLDGVRGGEPGMVPCVVPLVGAAVAQESA
jgi:hypothetical protein